ncbi:hypothetical protein PHYSODRAFT_292768 [Phytophthora sojae]|uniref:RxLR effector protein n=2 Tax=Phytophthora sojae TaxID=67593 RepID=G5AII1_PHYSP|nr:hypothetical protein PHYSODRAFT_292768 [Phytophthora sojae]AEK80815.1 Avh169a1 [Phytophthora sojae]AEK80816.1 Avh169a1 [Phytophthora sojae]AEK80817.1 Avh169a1 [Phytophthora sojae]EGZ04682.1 hypothetical protein PHYSODRAFT_292768 [Phytophthora sojae]|eukprot:XP_009539882.1 hypothetical protein PHYSODRAFT_292768 [Phytophthora sojae]
MRFLCFALLCGVFFLLTKVDAASTVTDSKVSTTAVAYSTSVDTVPTKSLRGDKSNNDESEERAFGINAIPGLKKITNFVDKQKTASWLKKGKVADDIFAKMKLCRPRSCSRAPSSSHGPST